MAAAVPLAGWARHRAHARAITWVPCRAPARAGLVGGADPPRTSAPEPAPTPQPSAAPTPLLPFVLPSLGVVELRAELRSRGAATHGTKAVLVSRLAREVAEDAMRRNSGHGYPRSNPRGAASGVAGKGEVDEAVNTGEGGESLLARLGSLRVVELRAELRARGLPQAGRKADLQHRLQKWCLNGDGERKE